jgi:hypothetical protein
MKAGIKLKSPLKQTMRRAKGFSSFLIMGLILMTSFNNCAKVTATVAEQASTVVGQDNKDKVIVDKSTSSVVRPSDGRVDITLVIDDSGSMRTDSLNLASKLDGFVNELEASAIDWQMCLTTTNLVDENGRALNWTGNMGATPQILKKGTISLDTIFTNTISGLNFGGTNSGDERGIAAIYRHIEKKNQHNCYRQNAAVATIIISDEDVRSVGGNRDLSNSQYKPLEAIDYPDNLLSYARDMLGSNAYPLRMVSNSVILKSGDAACQAIQNAQNNTVGFPGLKYEELSQKTNGKIGSICDPDYTAALKDFATQIKKSLVSVSLECAPINGQVSVVFTPNLPIQYHIENQSIIIDSEITQEVTVKADYKCAI